MKRCPNCGREFSDANRFCGGCGGPLVAATEAAGLGRCPNCDTPLRPNWKFCGKCQTPLAVGQADARPSPANWEPSPRPPADAPVALRCPACLLAVEDDGGDFCEHCGASLQAADVPQALPPDPTPQLPAYGPALAPAQAAASPSHEATPSEATPVGDAQTPGGRFLAFTEPATGEELRPEEATADEPCPSPPAGAASSAAVTADVNLGADPPPETRENPSVQPSQAAWEESVGAVRAPAANDDSGAPARAESSGAAERADSSGPAEEFVLPRYDEPPSGDLFEGSLAADRSPLRKWLVPGGAALCLLLVAGVLLLRSGARSEVKADATPTPAATPAPPPEGMVLVPDGAFRMGRDGGDPYESPTHEVTVKAFYLDAHEVTCEQYAKFIAETRHAPPQTWPGGRYDPTEARLPVTGVSWADAQAYAAWAGKRLPTEEEWEFAARGTDGRLYPWGNEWRPNAANAADTSAGRMVEVGTYRDGASPFGALDMVGNAWEWTASSLKAYPGGGLPEQPADDRMVIRGNYWNGKAERATTTFRRGYPARGDDYQNTSFRCAKDIGPAPAR